MKRLKDVLAKNLKINRMKQGLTQEKLAEKAGISTHYLAMIELGRKFPSAEMMERLAAALEIEGPQLFNVLDLDDNALKRFQESVIAEIKRTVSISIKDSFEKERKNTKDTEGIRKRKKKK